MQPNIAIFVALGTLLNLVYLDNFASYVASHFVNPEAFTRGFGVRLCLFKPRKNSHFLKRFMISDILVQLVNDDANTIILF